MNLKKSIGGLPCFYCSVDEGQLKLILILMIGSFVLGSLCILLWSLAQGVFINAEKSKYDVFEADKRE